MIVALHQHNQSLAYEKPAVQKVQNGPGMSSFERIRLLGRGRFGKVYLVKMKHTESYYAMKMVKQKKLPFVNHTSTEQDVLTTIKSPFVVPLFYTFHTKSHLCMVMEYLPGGALFSHLQKLGRFTESHTVFYAAEIVLGIEALHKKGIIYRDLKPENVLLDSKGHIKLTDFGLSKRDSIEDQKRSYTFCGTAEYLAPEIITSVGYTKAVDWWSLGVIIFEMLAGHPPFEGKNRKELMENIVKVMKDIVIRLNRGQ